MIVFNSKQKDRNYHRSKKKFFNHNEIKNSKQKPIQYEQANNISNNLHLRAKSPSKQEKAARSPSKQSRKSKKSVFSDQDKLLTKQLGSNFVEYGYNTATDRKREFKSPDIGLRKNDKMKDRVSQDAKRLARRSKQLQKQQPRRKQKYPKLFEQVAQTPKYAQRTPPRSPKHDFMQQKGQIDPIAAKQAQQLDGLKQQNQYYKLIYRASLQKMKRLETNIEKQKQDYERTKKQFEKQLRELKYKINRADKKINIGHIYSYDHKELLKVQPDKIITETDNQASEMTQMNEPNNKIEPSRLSIDSL